MKKLTIGKFATVMIVASAVYFLGFCVFTGWMFDHESEGWVDGLVFGTWVILTIAGLALVGMTVMAADEWSKRTKKELEEKAKAKERGEA